MNIEHIAIWVSDLEGMKAFYMRFFGMQSGNIYRNQKKQYSSCFLSFGSGARIELMHRPDIHGATDPGNRPGQAADRREQTGLSHLAITTGSREEVDRLTAALRKEGHIIAGEPRITGDGYYESVVLDPEGNRLEITE